MTGKKYLGADLSRKEAMDAAGYWVSKGWVVYFNFTCCACGARCTLAEPNILYEKGECCECGHETVLDKVGFLVTNKLL